MKFFAEGLPRLGIVNLQIRLDARPASHISLSVTAGEQKAILCHGKETSVLALPSPSSATETFTYPPGQSEIALRMSTERSNCNEEYTPLLSAEDVRSKWQQGAKLSCRNCHQDILSNPQMRWKDLPSESWAEYSDYWLCHPGGSHPHSHSHSHTPQTSEPGTNIHLIPNLAARPGIGLVGLTSILFDPKDIQNILFKVYFLFLSPFGLKESTSLPTQRRGADTKVPNRIPTYPIQLRICGHLEIYHVNDKDGRRENIKR
jgi:hypothetical protein